MDVTKLKDEAPDDIEDVQGQRKRPRMDQGKEGLFPSDVLQVHPLKINLHLYDDEASDLELAKLVILTFEYLVKLNIVCVGIEASDEGPNNNDILCNLFPDDNGLELPHQVYERDVFPFMSMAILHLYICILHLFLLVYIMCLFCDNCFDW